MEKYLFLYLNTGGGHYSPAKAIAETIKKIRGTNIEIILHDGLTGTRPYMRKIIEDGYKNSVNKALWSFEMLYAINKIEPFSIITADIVTYFVKSAIRNIILKEQPDKVIVYHYFLIRAVNEIIRENKLDIPVVVVVTDPYTAPSGWFLDEDQNFIVFSDMLKEKCIKMGIKSENIQVFPFVLDQKFSVPSNNSIRIKIRKDLGFREDSKIILIMGGGDGMPRGGKIFTSMVSSGIEELINCIEKVRELHSVNKVILNGDIFELLKYSFFEIRKARPILIRYLLNNDFIILKGNHDIMSTIGKEFYRTTNSSGQVIHIEHGHNADWLNGNFLGRRKKRYMNSGSCPLGRFQCIILNTETLTYEMIKETSESMRNSFVIAHAG